MAHVAFQMAEVAILKTLFAEILRMIVYVAASAGRINRVASDAFESN